jgi:hypothetical protein
MLALPYSINHSNIYRADIWVATKDKRHRVLDNFIQDILREGITHVQTPLVIEI